MIDFTGFIIFFPILLISVALHEFAHCWTTYQLGDNTPKDEGRLTLNPLAHLDPMGTVMMVVSSLAQFGLGWGRSSPFNPINFRHPARDRMISALAGPLMNIFQMLAWCSIYTNLISFSAIMSVSTYEVLIQFSYYGIVINASLAAFNLIPIYPLDGHHILGFFLPPSGQRVVDNPAWSFIFLALVFFEPLRTHILEPIIYPVTSFLMGVGSLLTGGG